MRTEQMMVASSLGMLIGAFGILTAVAARSCGEERTPRRTPPSWDSASMEQCAQAEAACMAVGERLGIHVTIPPWQAMVLTPVLDPR